MENPLRSYPWLHMDPYGLSIGAYPHPMTTWKAPGLTLDCFPSDEARNRLATLAKLQRSCREAAGVRYSNPMNPQER